MIAPFFVTITLKIGDIYPIIISKEVQIVPAISVFYGILILMHLTRKEHHPPHIHAFYGEYEATFLISTGELYKGLFPNKGQELVKEFILKYQNELMEMWDTEQYKRLPPID